MPSLLEPFLFMYGAMLAKPDTLEDALLINFRDLPMKDA